MFGLFKSKPQVNHHPDRVWMKSALRYQSLVNDVIQLQLSRRPVMVVFFFEDAGAELQRLFTAEQVSFGELKMNTATELRANREKAALVNGLDLAYSQSLIEFAGSRAQSGEVHILCAGHYPLPATEKELLAQLAQQPNAKNIHVRFYTSMEDGLMKIFGAEKMIKLMEMLGMKEDDVLEHAMISKSIGNAQEKVAKKVMTEKRARSEEEWFRLNMPNTN